MVAREFGASSRFSAVHETPAAEPVAALQHFRSKLAFETDPADLFADTQKGRRDFVVIDARSRDAFLGGHIPGAVNLPSRQISAETVGQLPRETVLVSYCWGPGCNGSTKAAAKLAALGFQVKELIGGIEYWQRDGYPLATGDP